MESVSRHLGQACLTGGCISASSCNVARVWGKERATTVTPLTSNQMHVNASWSQNINVRDLFVMWAFFPITWFILWTDASLFPWMTEHPNKGLYSKSNNLGCFVYKLSAPSVWLMTKLDGPIKSASAAWPALNCKHAAAVLNAEGMETLKIFFKFCLVLFKVDPEIEIELLQATLGSADIVPLLVLWLSDLICLPLNSVSSTHCFVFLHFNMWKVHLVV